MDNLTLTIEGFEISCDYIRVVSKDEPEYIKGCFTIWKGREEITSGFLEDGPLYIDDAEEWEIWLIDNGYKEDKNECN